MGRFLEIMLDLLLPRRCPFCGEISEGICESCRRRITVIGHPYCYRCGRPLKKAEREFCEDCSTHKHFFRQGRSLYPYEKEAKDAVYALKYQNKREYLDYFAREMTENFQKELQIWNPEVVLPIPMHKKDFTKRGYNQAEILAAKFGRESGLTVCTDVLHKVRRTASQKEMDYRRRRKNLQGAFDVNTKYLNDNGELPWKRVLLADDIYTTGSTLDEAAKVLMAHGVEAVFFMTICIVAE